MPQMAPISWTILFLIFSICFVIFNVVNFYNKNFFVNSNKSENKKTNKTNKMNFITWQW